MARKTKEAFKWIVRILRKHKIPFQISGGFAVRVYGSHRKLMDIDIGVPDKKLKEILPDVKPHVTYGPKIYKNKEWNHLALTLNYKGQEIDIYGSDNIRFFDSRKKKWMRLNVKLTASRLMKVYGINVPVIQKSQLIRYKRLIGRDVDIKDIKVLTKS